MPDFEHQDEPTYYERTDTLTQFQDFVSGVIDANMYPPEQDTDDAESGSD